MTRVATLAQFDRTQGLIQDTQQQWNKLQLQIASGLKSQDYAGIAPDAQRLVSLQATQTQVQQYTTNNNLVGTRLQTMDNSISQIYTVMGQYKTLLINALNGNNGASAGVTQQAQQMLDQVSALLNVKDGDRYLFSGSKTNTQPVDLSGLPASYTIPTSAGDSIGYYKGDNVALKVQADASLQVTYGVTAGDPSIEAAIRALDLGVKEAPTDTAAMNDALNAVNQALDTMPDLRTHIGAAQNALTNIAKSQTDFMQYADQNVSDIQNVDVTQAISQMNDAQLSLNASYMTISKLSQLSLLNFLK